ncbi:phosphatase [Coprobacter secundus]|uniref:Phosphatase n=1 Tax=Coprobacter secundus subsp. similis TaxID=2751153 RepID=A0A7G1HZT7_9BACT|nr:phosphatase [Coprobacter secundus]BCI63017.1 phosphatase [Coprobacter secundus subsp. similis]
MNILLDVHTHTVASGHAFSSLQEMVHTASEKHLQILGVTEHTPGIPGTCHPIYFRNLHVVPRKMYGIELLLGAELNIIDYMGNIDLEELYLQMLDIKIAGIHSLCYTPGNIEENTSAMIGAISNPYIDIISHPGDGTATLLFEPVVLASKKYGTLLEINNSSLNPVRHKTEARKNNIEILQLCKKYEVPVILGSDAHISFDIANYENIYPLLQETEFPQELIINDKPETFKKRINVTSQKL